MPKENRGPGTFNGQQLNTGEFVPRTHPVRQQQKQPQQTQQQQFGNLRQQQQQQIFRPNQQAQQFGKLRKPQPQFQIRAGRIQVQTSANNGQFNPQLVPAQQFQQQQVLSAQQPQQAFPPQQTFTGQQPQQIFPPQQPQQFPLNQYGPPITQYGPPQPQPPQQYPSTENNKPDADDDIDSEPVANVSNENNDDDDDNDNEGPSISVSNSGANGQYYILTPDNTLQKVIYMTSQTEDDIRTNGFTAQLRYEPVEPIRDPVYGYDAEGHLVKIYNKK